MAFQIEIVFQRGNTLVMMLLLLWQKAYLYVASCLLTLTLLAAAAWFFMLDGVQLVQSIVCYNGTVLET